MRSPAIWNRAAFLLPLASLLLAACGDDHAAGPAGPELPVGPPAWAVVVDASLEGRFFYNPPVGSGGTAISPFDPTLLPALFLELCESGTFVEDRCTSPLARYTSTAAGPDGKFIELLIDEEQYRVEVQFKNLPGADDGDIFIGRVGVGDPDGVADTDFLVFGTFSVALGDGNGVEDDLEANPNRTLPVKWFTGEGLVVAALDGDPEGDVGTGVIGSDGGRVETESGFYVVEVPPGAVPEGETVTITIEAKEEPTAEDPCVETETFPFALQAEGCADFTAIPDITFETPVIVGVCLDPTVVGSDNYQLAKDDGTSVVLLEPASIDIDCVDFVASADPDGTASDFLGRLASRTIGGLTRGVARLLGPTPLQAADAGFGGSTTDFSFIGWVLAPDIEIVSGDGQLAPSGTTVEAKVLVQTAHFKPVDGPAPIANTQVSLSITSGGEIVTGSPVLTDANGLATIQWTVGTGANTLTATAGLDAVSFDATGGTYQIAFHRNAPGSREVWTLLTDGTSLEAGPVKLQDAGVNDENPKWSRAGDRIAFMSNRSGSDEIWIMNADGSGPVQLTSAQSGVNRPHSWGPGDLEIAFTTTRNNLFQIARLPADGSGTPFFIRDFAGSPDWSPDGAFIATEGFVDDGEGGGANQIVVIRPDGTGEVNMSADFTPELRPDWSPGGGRIAFTRFDPEGDIWVMDVDVLNGEASNRTNLTPSTPNSRDQDPVWSPDGAFIAFFSDRDDPGNNFDLYIMKADGTGVVRLTTDPAFDGAPDFRF